MKTPDRKSISLTTDAETLLRMMSARIYELESGGRGEGTMGLEECMLHTIELMGAMEQCAPALAERAKELREATYAEG